ncbi:MAG: lytic murein transglycosylase B [Kangiellaceae bacterium]|nr:lytic murein transglycosylase B [Kangiellaceae bacterium]
MKRKLSSVLTLAALLTLSANVFAERKAPTNAKDFAQYMQEKHGFTADYVQLVLGKAQKRDSILKAMSRPAEGKDWYEYRPIFLTDKRIKQGVEFWQSNEETLSEAQEKFQVPAEIITAIIGVETFYGRIQGSYPVIEAISTLAFHYPKRAKFFAGELEEYFVLAREQGWDLAQPKGSYAGAMGMGQFIPSSYRYYAVDFDGDNKINLFDNTKDAIGSVANYFNKHHWRLGEPVAEYISNVTPELVETFRNKELKPQFDLAQMKQAGFDYHGQAEQDAATGIYAFQQESKEDYWLGFHNFYVITRYNRSPMYAMAVYQLSQEIRKEYEKQKQSTEQTVGF